jgi:hypothetical protein
MPFTIPDIPVADPSVNRPARNVSPTADAMERLVDIERSIATEGRVIWGFGRDPVSLGQPTQAFEFEGGLSTWMPFADFLTRVPHLGAGPRNPTTDTGNIGMALWAFPDDFRLDLRVTISRTDTSVTPVTRTPTRVVDSNGNLRWKINDLPTAVVEPDTLVRIQIEYATPDAPTSVYLYAAGAYWLDIQDIDP